MNSHGFAEIDPFFVSKDFDPLEVLAKEAHERNIAVIPWFEYGFAASPLGNGGHLIAKKPHWAALDRGGNKVRHGGLTWMNSLNPEVQKFMRDLILEVVRKPNIDGIQGDDRLPALPFTGGYDDETKKHYKIEHGINPPSNEKNARWVKWRADILTQFLSDLVEGVKTINPNLIVSMAPAIYPFCLNNLLQDSQAWIKKELLDFIHPQIYRETLEGIGKYRHQVEIIARMFDRSQRAKFAPGIALRAYNKDVSVNNILKYVDLNRERGFRGQVFFHYEGLRKNNNEIPTALQQTRGYTALSSPSPFIIV